MRVSPAAVAIVALAVAVLGAAAGLTLIDPPRPLLVSAGFDRDAITPNADGEADVATFAFELARSAAVSLTLSDGVTRYVIRENQHTGAGTHALAFSGVVDGFVLDGETLESVVERRLIPDGAYTWTFEAQAADGGESGTATGTLTVADADTELPLLSEFTVSPTVFTPNQDAISDRVAINAFLSKQAEVTGFLIGPDGERVYLPTRGLENRDGEVGWQEFDYAGGVDIGADPPPDGSYTVVIEAQDAAGQRVSVSGELTIQLGGKPRAGILVQGTGADVVFTDAPYDESSFSDINGLGTPVPVPDDPDDARLGQVVVPVGDLLVFMLVVENYGSSPIRTDGPPPGTVYQQNQLAAALYQESQDDRGIGAIEQDGVWRVGIQCETSEESYPYRWAVGSFDELSRVEDEASGNTYYYLEPEQRSVVWGAVRMTDAYRARNPQQCWAGLIHEGVDVVNQRIGARDVLIADPNLE